jgi:hypothetical protein
MIPWENTALLSGN